MKPETEIRNLRREIKYLAANAAARGEELRLYRIRASKAEQDAAEWKRRFDLLLARTPENQKS